MPKQFVSAGHAPSPRKPLTGLRIVDITTAWAGPMAGRVLSYLGADVVHVEAPQRIDSWRGPLNGGDHRRYPDGEYGARPYNRSCMFNTQNQGKRAVGIDLKQPGGVALLKKLIRVSDAVLVNFTPGALARMGLGTDVLRLENPNIVVIEMPGFGSEGPMSAQVALGPTMEGASGMAYFVGYGDGRPYVTGPAYLDPIGAFNGAATVVTTLMAQRRDHAIERAELPQCEAAMHWIGELLLAGIAGQSHTPDTPNASQHAEPHGAYQCAGDDQWVTISIESDLQWDRLCQAMGNSDAAGKFHNAITRRRKRAEVTEIISAWTRRLDKHQVAAILQETGIPAAPVCSGEDVANREDLQDAGFFQEFEHPDAGKHLYQGLPFRIGDSLLKADRPAPVFGQHNEEVIKDLLGVSDSCYDDLVDARVVASTPEA
ncbi:CaiB/BaiF CoA transferase family protein [Antricoccus suffuscus]|nr:CoA transferase [Antricoccus suffuscus]